MQPEHEGIRAQGTSETRVARRHGLDATGNVRSEYMYNSTTDSADG